MKNKIIKLSLAAFLLGGIVSCSRFDELNVDPFAVTSEKTQPEYFLNASILGAQMNPHIAERAFVLYWKTAGHHQLSTGISGGTHNDGWSNDYWSALSGWLNSANLAITIGKEKAENGSAREYNNNIIQMARIWRAYLMSEMADNFGSISINAFQGVNPEFHSQKEAYFFMLDELKDAISKIDVNAATTGIGLGQDPAYQFNWDKWIRYANSMRMRLAMRIAEVEPTKAKAEFEDAVKGGKFIDTNAHNFKIAENAAGSWDDLSPVMSRQWNIQFMSATVNNLYLGLGGVESAKQFDEETDAEVKKELLAAIKPSDYIGVNYPEFFTTKTNDPSAGYWLDGLPNKIDPRAYKTFYIPGYFKSPEFSLYPTWTNHPKTTEVEVTMEDGSKKKIDCKYTWNAFAAGDWGAKGTKNPMRGGIGKAPALAQTYRGADQKGTTHRIFFGSWESYFLIAEAALKGWNVPMSDEVAYNRGIKESFDNVGVSKYYAEYIASTDYSRNGTSVNYSHTAEPGNTHTMKYIDGTTGTENTVEIKYPSNTIYKNGAVRNDKLTKIITQKYLANVPYLPLEGWNDHRRLGLPFFENPAIENKTLPNLPALTEANFMTNSISVFPQRLPYPSSFKNSDQKGYNQAIGFLGGEDSVFTPLWWAKKN